MRAGARKRADLFWQVRLRTTTSHLTGLGVKQRTGSMGLLSPRIGGRNGLREPRGGRRRHQIRLDAAGEFSVKKKVSVRACTPSAMGLTKWT